MTAGLALDTPVDFKEHTRAVDALAGYGSRAQQTAKAKASERAADVTAKERKARLQRAAELIKSALELPAATHGVNIYTKSTLMLKMAIFYAELGDYANAVGSAGRAIAANPLSARPYVLVAEIQAQVGSSHKALQALDNLEQIFGTVCQRCHERKQKQGRQLHQEACGPACDEVKSALLMRLQLRGNKKQEL